MAEITYLTSTFLMGILLIVVMTVVASMRNWRQYAPQPEAAGDGGGYAIPGESALSRGVRNPVTWFVTFFLLVFAVGGASVLFLDSSVDAWLIVGAIFGPLLVAFLFWGAYESARSRGMSNSIAAGVASTVLGALLLVAITVKLLFGG